MSYTTVNYCGIDHSIWLKELVFYDEELDTLEKRLLEIVQKNNGKEVMADVEHFQNQFVIQRINIDQLQHDIRKHDGNVAAEAQAHAGKMKSVEVSEHDKLKEQVETFGKLFNELRHEYNKFLSKWM